LQHVFELFVQADTSLQRPHSGLGIGLTLSRRLIEMHGGTIQACSEGLGKGSGFTVTLPLAAAGTRTVEEKAPPARSSPARPLRIMVVDDNHDSADMLALSLKIMGHEVRTLYDPLRVADAAPDFDPQLIFMDIGMPGLNGFDLAEQVLSRPWRDRPPRLIALTGWGQEEDRQRSVQAGFSDHLDKPADLETIERVLLEATGQVAAGRGDKS
jgi:CheY-like chemotaxis protein